MAKNGANNQAFDPDFDFQNRKMVFDKSKDLTPVSQFGFVNLAELAANNAIPSDVSASASEFNGIEEPGEVMPRPSDVFEEMHQHKAINDYRKSKMEAAAAAAAAE